MTMDLEVRDTGIAFLEDSFGGLKTDELVIPYEDLDEWEIEVDVAGSMQLSTLISKGTDDEVTLRLSQFETSDVQPRKTTQAESTPNTSSTTDAELSSTHLTHSNMPPIPDDSGLETEADRAHYDRLKKNPDSQPAQYRRLIRNEGSIDRPRFDRWARRQGFEPETGGSHNASLLMLERIGEIERNGRSDDQQLIWVGE